MMISFYTKTCIGHFTNIYFPLNNFYELCVTTL